MLSDAANAPLVDTLETYLELAGDARATAEALTLHRATLYHRLNRIEKLTGARLKTGDDRLALHLGLRLARLSGLR
jgi:sugar diacid utilization regulator